MTHYSLLTRFVFNIKIHSINSQRALPCTYKKNDFRKVTTQYRYVRFAVERKKKPAQYFDCY